MKKYIPAIALAFTLWVCTSPTGMYAAFMDYDSFQNQITAAAAQRAVLVTLQMNVLTICRMQGNSSQMRSAHLVQVRRKWTTALLQERRQM